MKIFQEEKCIEAQQIKFLCVIVQKLLDVEFMKLLRVEINKKRRKRKLYSWGISVLSSCEWYFLLPLMFWWKQWKMAGNVEWLLIRGRLTILKFVSNGFFKNGRIVKNLLKIVGECLKDSQKLVSYRLIAFGSLSLCVCLFFCSKR
jgi:hypothetical protein